MKPETKAVREARRAAQEAPSSTNGRALDFAFRAKKVKAFDAFGANAQVQQAAPARVVALGSSLGSSLGSESSSLGADDDI